MTEGVKTSSHGFQFTDVILMKKINIVLVFVAFFFLNSCATYDAKYSGEKLIKKSASDKKI